MSAPNELDLAFNKFQSEMHQEAQALDAAKTELQHTETEIETLKRENDKAAQEIKVREAKIKIDFEKEKAFKVKITHLTEEQRKDHQKLAQMESENRARLTKEGVRIAPPHS